MAHRTYIDGDDMKTFADPNRPMTKDWPKLNIKYWERIHLPFNETVSRNVYFQEHENIITHRIYLRMLYEMLTDDKPLGGADFVIERHLKEAHHPLTHFFALRGPINERPPNMAMIKYNRKYEDDGDKCCGFIKGKFDNKMKECDEIRDYYGESVGFYFHFLMHYTKWLYPMSLLGLIWFIIQMGVSQNYGIATPGSTIIIIIAIMWSTFMIENWYRREWKLRYALLFI